MVSKIKLARAGTLMVAASRVGQQGYPAFLRRMDRPADRQIDLQPKSAGTRPRSRAQVSLIATWLDAFGGDADKASVLLECAARDLAAATWIIKPADHERPPGWLADSRAMRRN